MYNFVDTNEVSEGSVLPSEALQINGEYIENLITGYRTLNVSGREALSPEVETYTTGIRDGSRQKGKRYPERILTITYQLIAESNEAFREAYNKLADILNVDNAELIFNDEQDKFYTGTPCTIGEVEPGRNAVVGEFEIICSDPFKYSVIEYEAEPDLDEGSILIDYNGTYKAYPVLEADFYSEDEVSEDGETATELTGNGDCGYVAFFNENEKIIQLGDPKEEDEETYAKSQALINQSFKKSSSWGVAAKDLWTAESGTMGMKVASYTTPTIASTSGTLLKNAKSTSGTPVFYYTVKAKTSGRTSTAVKVEVSITASMANNTNHFGTGLGLMGSIYLGGTWHDITIKKSSVYWSGTKGHTVSKTITVSNINKDTTSLTGIKFKVARSDNTGSAGKLSSTNCSDLKISAYVAPTVASYYLGAKDYGSASGEWHGASIIRELPTDASGDTGAANFTVSWGQKMCIGNSSADTKQLGGFLMKLMGANGNAVAAIRIRKNKVGNKATFIFWVADKVKQNVVVDLSYKNKYFGAGKAVGTSTITKSGKKVSFNIGGMKKTFTDTAIQDLTVTKIKIEVEQFSTSPALSYNGIYSVKFVKNNCDTWEDIPNKFSTNDIVEADCKNGEVYLNGSLEPAYGALGNDWEDFYLKPGLNQIGVSYSDWVKAEYAPAFKVRYREVFL